MVVIGKVCLFPLKQNNHVGTLADSTWAGFSIDPYLAGQLVSETVTAVQAAGVITSTKARLPISTTLTQDTH